MNKILLALSLSGIFIISCSGTPEDVKSSEDTKQTISGTCGTINTESVCKISSDCNYLCKNAEDCSTTCEEVNSKEVCVLQFDNCSETEKTK